MAILDIFSKRQKRLRGEVPEVYIYDVLPDKLKVQIVQILRDTIGVRTPYYSRGEGIYEFIHLRLCREYGVFTLGDSQSDSNEYSLLNYFLKSQDTDKLIDIIELSFKTVHDITATDAYYLSSAQAKMTINEAVEELNTRFKENGVGYQFDANEIIRVDSTYAHAEIVKPTIALLWSSTFKGANEEYLKAHEHYRHGRNKECLTECLKAFESTMKTICQEKGWMYNQTDTASKLIQVCFNNGLVPVFTQNQFTSLRNLLESGIPPLRNKLSGHGQGQIPQSVGDEMIRYGLNLTGTNIIFLVEQSGIK